MARSIDSLFAQIGEEDVEGGDSTPVAAPSRPEPEPAAEPSAHESAEVEAEGDGEAELEATGPVAVAGKHLMEAVSVYLLGASDQRPALAEAVSAAVEEARSLNALDGLAEALDKLLVHTVPDPEAEAFAREIMSPAVESRMAIRLGFVKDEARRKALIQAYSGLGDSMAEVISDALSATDDRSARSTYVSALVALGRSGMRVVERMVKDSRWFVVRNGVAVLGEVGGEEAVGLLTGTLANEDARVRRETVLSLARIGGKDASGLVVGMLDDAEPAVRAAAARAVSVLKVEDGHRQLMEIVEQGDEDAVIEQALRALGQLGDPAAVPVIEKHAVGSFFSKPPTEIRIAALSALGAIGTPHAMSVVEGAGSDKDADIRSAAQQILSAR